MIRLLLAYLNYCIKALTQSTRSKESFTSRIRGLEWISVGRVGQEEDIGRGELDLVYIGRVESYERFNTIVPMYTLTSLVDFEGGSGVKELRSLLTDFMESEEGLGGRELSLSSGYIQGIVVSEEKIHLGARLGKDYNRVSDDSVS